MALKLWEKVNYITGNSSKSRILIDYINQGSKFVVASLPEKFLWSIANEENVQGHNGTSSVIGNGSSTPYDKILAVYRYDGSTTSSVVNSASTISSEGTKKRVCVEVEDQNIHIFDEPNSLLRASKMFPKFYKLGGKIYIKPDPDYNADDATYNYTDVDSNTITVNATSGDKGVIVYAAPPQIDENTDAWILVEYENVVLQYACHLDALYQGGKHRDSALTSLTGVTTALSSYLSSFPSHSIKDVVKPSAPSAIFSSVTPSTALPSVPNFAGVSLPVSLNVSTSLPSDFAITETLPSDLTVNTALPSIVMPSEVNISYAEVNDAHAKAKALVDDYDGIGGGDTEGEGDTEVNSQTIKSSQQWLIEEDPEMVEANLAIASSELRRATSELASQKSQLEEFQAEVGAAQQKFGAELQKFQAELAKDQARVQQEVQEYQADVARESQEITSQISKYSAELQKEAQKAGVDVQVAQAEIAKLQATFQGDITKYTTELSLNTNTLQKEVQQYTNDLQKYSANIQKYSTEVQTEVQSYASDIKKRERFIQEAGVQMQKSQQYMQVSQQQYGLSGQYYQKAVSELQSITGTLSAPPQQQKGQRQEERKSS